MFGKYTFLLGWFVVAFGLCSAACADFGDAEGCYHFARLYCEKTGHEGDGCMKALINTCRGETESDVWDYDDDYSEAFAECADALEKAPDCITHADFMMICPDVQNRIPPVTSSCDP